MLSTFLHMLLNVCSTSAQFLSNISPNFWGVALTQFGDRNFGGNPKQITTHLAIGASHRKSVKHL